MRTSGTGHGGTGRRTGTGAARAAAVAALVALLAAGCAAGADGSADAGGAEMQSQLGSVGGTADDAGGAVDDAGGAADGSAQGGSADAGADGADRAAAAAGRQVVTTGEVALAAADPRAAADRVVTLVEQAGGRVDARQESAGDDELGVDASADLTVRVPADGLTAVLDALEDVGDVARVDLRSQDVTAAAQDLDARIRAMRLSVARMEDLLARATSTDDVIEAERTLTDRQGSLESLEAQRARVAEQVALSTLQVTIWSSGVPAATEAPARTGFLGGVRNGWDALVSVLGVTVLVLGTLLPWLAVAAALWGAAVLVRRRLRRRTAGAAGGGPGGAGRPGAGGPGAGGPGAGGPGAGGAGGPGAGGPGAGGAGGPGAGGPGAGGAGGPGDGPQQPGGPVPDDEREPVGAGSPRG